LGRAAAYLVKADGSKKSGGVGDVFLRVVALLLCALAAEFFILGLRTSA
jgi:small neutral amino acid transporter SnatA (MarC family)